MKLNNSLKITTSCMNLLWQTDTIVAKGTIFVWLQSKNIVVCVSVSVNIACVSDLIWTYLLPIKVSIKQICVTGHRYKTRTMSEHNSSTNSIEKRLQYTTTSILPALFFQHISFYFRRIFRRTIWKWNIGARDAPSHEDYLTVARVRLPLISY